MFNRNILYALGAVVLAAAVWYFSDIVTYILLAWVLSMLGRPLMVFIQRKLRWKQFRIGKTGAALLTILSFFLLITGLLLLFVPTIVSQARNLANVDYTALGEKLRIPFTHLDYQAHQLGVLQINESLATKIQETLSLWFKPALVGDFVGSFLSTAGNVMVTISAVTFILFFFLEENNLFTGIIHALVPDTQEQKVKHVVQESSEVLTRYVRGLMIQLGAFSMMISLMMWMLGIPNALLIGAFGGLLNVVPYVGPVMGLIFGCFITASSHLDLEFAMLWPMLLKVSIVFMIAQVIDNLFLSTIIFSKSVQAHPLEIFIVTLMAAKMGGVVGMVFGIPIYTVMRVVARTYFHHYKVVQRLTDHLDDEEV